MNVLSVRSLMTSVIDYFRRVGGQVTSRPVYIFQIPTGTWFINGTRMDLLFQLRRARFSFLPYMGKEVQVFSSKNGHTMYRNGTPFTTPSRLINRRARNIHVPFRVGGIFVTPSFIRGLFLWLFSIAFDGMDKSHPFS